MTQQHWSAPFVEHFLRQIYADNSRLQLPADIKLDDKLKLVGELVSNFQAYVDKVSQYSNEIFIRMLYALHRIAAKEELISYPPENLFVLVALQSFKLQHPEFTHASIIPTALKQFNITDYVSAEDEAAVAVLSHTEISVASQASKLWRLPVMQELVQGNNLLSDFLELLAQFHSNLRHIIDMRDNVTPFAEYIKMLALLLKTDNNFQDEKFIQQFIDFKTTIQVHRTQGLSDRFLERRLELFSKQCDQIILCLESLKQMNSKLLYPDSEADDNVDCLKKVFRPFLYQEETTYGKVVGVDVTDVTIFVPSNAELEEEPEEDWLLIAGVKAVSLLDSVESVVTEPMFNAYKRSNGSGVLSSSCRSSVEMINSGGSSQRTRYIGA